MIGLAIMIVSVRIIDDPSSLSCFYASSLALNTTRTKNDLHACVDSPFISCQHCLYKSHDDMLALSCSHDKNDCVSSSLALIPHTNSYQ